ncbi:uroporphyrin-III C-methyltransferase [Aureococcus anophagefferens]|nr:uroporphyrin-III C-methyltransferase [Aureococcus anophagefferens]
MRALPCMLAVAAALQRAPRRVAPPAVAARRNVALRACDQNLSKKGTVTLVGAGPGDPELLTVAALRLISDPEALVVADRLVSPEIRSLVQGELRVAGKAPGCAEKAQREIYDWCVEGVNEGRRVIRLKIGDPFVFGRGGEEILEFRETLGLEAEVVPGVSSCLAAPLAAGVPVTHRGAAHQLVVSTGYGRDGSSPELPYYDENRTVVLLMAVGRLGKIVANCLEAQGFPRDCPASFSRSLSRSKSRSASGEAAAARRKLVQKMGKDDDALRRADGAPAGGGGGGPVGELSEEEQMRQMLGFGGFATTKDAEVPDNQTSARAPSRRTRTASTAST